MTTYTNGQVDTAAAAVPTPYGPFTRVTDLLTQPTPNDMFKIQFTDANGKTIYMTYADVTTTAVRNKRIAEVYGYQYVLHALIAQVDAINTSLQAVKQVDGNGYTIAQFENAVELLRGIDVISGYL